ncbi:hypothetical protein SAY87_014500 [Trapa incisa]|uniref:Serine acetyltransferase N-terminal domain-containing protein n=1 Tax=Trapa incisa TaxID=236973 RepID=A0AAN7H007_9MYRT|nr:hypothetical protein SAY87_014500 [Trapa incisa]
MPSSRATQVGQTCQDLRAVLERDPACASYVHCFLNFKGLLAIQSHRVVHKLWSQGRDLLALLIQNVWHSPPLTGFLLLPLSLVWLTPSPPKYRVCTLSAAFHFHLLALQLGLALVLFSPAMTVRRFQERKLSPSSMGDQSIAGFLKFLESVLFPSHYKAVEEKLLAWEETWMKKYEMVKVEVEELRTVDNVLNASTARLWRENMKRLEDKIAVLLRENETLEAENADWRRDYENLEKRMCRVEKAIHAIEGNGLNGGITQGGETGGLSGHKVKWPICWEEIVFRTPGKPPKSPAGEKLDWKGTVLDISDDDGDDSVAVTDPIDKRSGIKDATGRIGAPQINGVKTTEAVQLSERSPVDLFEPTLNVPKRRRSSVIGRDDRKNDSETRKLRKLEACSIVREEGESPSKSPVGANGSGAH